MNDDSLAYEVSLAMESAIPPREVDRVDQALDHLVEERSFSPEVKALIQRCLEGTEPAELKYWENDKFGPQHINAVVLRAAGFRPGEVAKAMGITPGRASVILNHPYAKKIILALAPEKAVRVFDIRTKMELYGSELLDHVFDLAIESQDLAEVRQAGFGLLDRIGHGPVNKSVSTSVPASAFGDAGGSGGDGKLLGRLAAAMEESNRLDREVMPNFKSQRPPEEHSLPGSEGRLGGVPGHHDDEKESVPSSSPSSVGVPQSEAAD
jgi:hypothetical protein